MLDRAADILVVGETGSGEEALVLAREARADLMLLDIHLPGLSGWDVARQLRRDLPTVKVRWCARCSPSACMATS
jgi:DNA-binding NarL/FixJ family response regulator